MQVWTNNYSGGVADTHDYNIEVNGSNLKLYRSAGKHWTEPNKKVGELFDDGNGVVVKIDGIKTISLDYSQLVELLTLLLANHKDRIEFRETKVIKSI